MMVKPLNTPSESTYRILSRWSRKLNVRLSLGDQKIRSLIILGNGTPDDITMLALAHKLNGKTIVGIFKPKYHREEALRVLKSLILREINTEKFLLVVDQENQALDDFKSLLREKLIEYSLGCSKIEESDRLIKYDCSLRYKFQLLIAINGLNRKYVKHTIEDYLLEVAISLNLVDNSFLRKANYDPKRAWNILGKKNQEKVIKNMLTMPIQKLETIFPQQISALKILMDTTS